MSSVNIVNGPVFNENQVLVVAQRYQNARELQ